MEKNEIITALAALAQQTRLDIFRMLVEEGPEGLSVGVIGERLSVAGATLNHHLTQLKQSGLISSRREGRQIIHVADFEQMDELISFLTKNCCHGDSAVCATN